MSVLSPSLQKQLALAPNIAQCSEYLHLFSACSDASSDTHQATGVPFHSL